MLPRLLIFPTKEIFFAFHYEDQSSRAALISASDFPAAFALCIIVDIKSSGERSRSAAVDSTPSLPARELTYPLFLDLPMFDNVE